MKTSLLKIGFYFLLSAFLFLNSNANAQGIINLKDDKASGLSITLGSLLIRN